MCCLVHYVLLSVSFCCYFESDFESPIIETFRKNPVTQQRMRRDLMKIMPENDTPLNNNTMKKMSYLGAVIKESLRLFPPIGTNIRRTHGNIVLKGYQIPKNVYGKAMECVPERWLRQQSEASDVCPHSLKQSHQFSFLPFGHGIRFCAGKRIAEMEIEVFISRIIRNYEDEWHYPDLQIKSTMVNIPDGDSSSKIQVH